MIPMKKVLFMEMMLCTLAALAAGVGTGLAGLSAATVMVPVMLVLCPSFAGETGAYHATAIALASDILGSAFTSAIYIRHRNIDLRRGGVMMACIITMCIAGSIAAWYAGNVVLGTFSLFLCVGIGIRFLLKPDTQREHTVKKGARLDLKGLAISLFFGLTIGFGTGFVGSGGGMMMLVVFTAFLGMERKSAVGTSTLIMTFTALIAFVSHAMVDPAIVFEKGDILLLCIVVESAASIVSARFANRVNSRIVGLVTGAVLTVLGVAMLAIHYREALAGCALLMGVLRCFGQYLLYLGACLAVLLSCRALLPISAELWRKALHSIAYTSSLFMMLVSHDWAAACACCLIFAAVVYPILQLAERWQGYDRLFTQRRPGEVKQSLLLLFCSHAALIALCWGWLGRPYIAVSAILMWGTGDTAAALVGKRFGRHHVHLPLADERKTWEGSLAMLGCALCAGFISLAVLSSYSLPVCLLQAAAAAPVAAYVELISHGGTDTVNVPVACALCLAAMSLL
ncbi:MAG: TSUP family transporter [Clostridia bacterium]|nr:TSUP family transporter [Clostridia bacterium]